MQDAHKIWLDHHPEYDEFWLSQATQAGFDIHHIDSNHDNNDIDNLLLIEKADHARLHGKIQPSHNGRDCWANAKNKLRLGESAYMLRTSSAMTWDAIALELGYIDNPCRAAYATNVARYYAKFNSKQWPIPHHKDCRCQRCKGRIKRAEASP